MPKNKVIKSKKSKSQKKDTIKNDGIFNFDEQVEVKKTKVTKTAQKKKKTNKTDLEKDHFIGENEVKHIDKKKLEKIKKEKLKEKRTKEKELLKEEKRQDKLRRKRAVQTKKARMTEEQIRKKRRIKTCIKLLLLLAVIIGLIIYLMLSPIFNIKNINVEGNSSISSEQIISLSNIQKDNNLFKVSNKDTISAIKENPYVKTVEIKRTLPDTITLVITERVKAYMLEHGSSYAYIDSQGYILEISANPMDGLAKITGYEEDIRYSIALPLAVGMGARSLYPSDVRNVNRLSSQVRQPVSLFFYSCGLFRRDPACPEGRFKRPATRLHIRLRAVQAAEASWSRLFLRSAP